MENMERKILEDFTTHINRIINLRQSLDNYKTKGNPTARGFAAEVQIELEEEIHYETKMADCCLVMLDQIKDNKSFITRLKEVLGILR